MRQVIYVLMTLLPTYILTAQLVIEWEQNYGGSDFEYLETLVKTEDNGFLLGGNTYSSDGDIEDHYGISDYWVVKIDALGNIEWEQNYGGSYLDDLQVSKATADGGFILAGSTDSMDGDVGSSTDDTRNAWVVKIDALGNIEWEKSYTGELTDTFYDIVITDDNGILMGGNSSDGNVNDDTVSDDYWLVKTDELGNVEWEKRYGGSEQDILRSIQQTSDGGFIVGGYSYSNNGDVGNNYGSNDYWIVKIDALGNMEWEQNYGGAGSELFRVVKEVNDGGFLLGGYSGSEDFDVDQNYGNYDYWVVKIDALGNIEWEQNYGGIEADLLFDFVVTEDNGFILGGASQSDNGDISDNHGNRDYWIVKTDSIGNVEWEQNYGGSDWDNLYKLTTTEDGGLLLAGMTLSNDIEVGDNYGQYDFWVVKLRPLHSTATVHLFHDSNENGVLDNDENLLFNLPHTITPYASFQEYSINESPTFYVFPNTYTVEYDQANSGLWQLVNAPTSHTFTVGAIPIDTTLYFPMRPITDFWLQTVDITSSIVRCNQEVNVWLTYANNSSHSTSGYIHLLADELATFVSANPPVDSISNDTLYWFYDNLLPTHSKQVHLIYQMPGVDFIEEEINFEAEMETWEGEGESKFYFGSELLCSCDPNDKLVSPEGIGEENYTLFEDNLFNYTIRFQNTGNDTAFSVIIRDTISEHLDLSTYQLIASSHDVKAQVDIEERHIEFLFEDIYLPDSNVNEPASHGFVKFRMESLSDLAENTFIENRAGIYFDQNPPIITNTTQNQMVSEIPTSLEALNTQSSIKIYPNPNTGHFIINAEQNEIKGYRLYNNIGQLLQEQKIQSSSIQVEANLKAGLYFLAVETAEELTIEKIIIQ